jgi:hypothetical protein
MFNNTPAHSTYLHAAFSAAMSLAGDFSYPTQSAEIIIIMPSFP